MPLPPAAEEAVEELLSLYRAAWNELEAELVAIASDPVEARRQVRRRRRLAELLRRTEASMAEIDSQATNWLRTSFLGIYADAAQEADEAIGRRFRWAQEHRDAVQRLASDAHTDLLAATRFVRTDVRRVVREASRVATRRVLLQGETSVAAGRRLGRDLPALLRAEGIEPPAAVVYRNGARHGLADYADVVTRTKAGEARSVGGINAGLLAGVEWFECSDGLDCGLSRHDDGEKAAGRVYPGSTATAYPLAHPRCARSWSPRPDVTTADQAAAARRYGPAEQQRLASAESVRARERTVTGRLTVRERTRRRAARTRSRRASR